MNVLLRCRQPSEQQHRADRIGDHRSDGNTVHGHPQYCHKEQIQRHIQYAGGEQRKEWDFGFPHTAKDRSLKVIEQDHRHSQQVNPQVEQRRGQHILRHMEGAKQRRGRQFSKHRNQNAAKHSHNDRSMYSLLCCIFVIASDGCGNHYISAQRNADEQIDDQGDNRAVCSNCRHRDGLSRAGEVSHHRNVGGIEQLL